MSILGTPQIFRTALWVVMEIMQFHITQIGES